MVGQVEETTASATNATEYPDILFDKVELGFAAVLTGTGPADLPALAGRLHSAGLIKRPPSRFGGHGGRLTVDFSPALPSGGTARVKGRLRLVLTQSGAIAVGPQSHPRAQWHAGAACA